jgi:2-iminoacetate synthase
MISIDHDKLEKLIKKKPATALQFDEILLKSKTLERLSLEEVALLLSVEDADLQKKVQLAAKDLKNEIYGKRLVVFAPLYISNLCNNDCAYCAFRAANKEMERRELTQKEIYDETVQLIKTGQKRVLLVSGESYRKKGLDYVLDSIDTVYSAKDGKNSIRRVNVNIAPLDVDEFKKLKKHNIGTYQIFQETYHIPTYQKMHLSGPKKNYQFRLETITRAFEAGIDDVGIGVLFGLYDYKFEMLALLSHIEYLEAKYGMGPHTISVPRLEPATGSIIASAPPYPVTDEQFQMIVSILRLAVPYTGIILSTRETAETRREAFDLGISQISAGSRTNPGGYSEEKSLEQFSLGDHRELDEVIRDVCTHGYIPSFCTGCYRLGRTGHDFMELAKPGDIREKCLPNALFTFMEYLQDYASKETKAIGLAMIEKELQGSVPAAVKGLVESALQRIEAGKRDIYL